MVKELDIPRHVYTNPEHFAGWEDCKEYLVEILEKECTNAR